MCTKPVLVLGASGRLGRLLQRLWSPEDALWQVRRKAACHSKNHFVCDPLAEPQALTAVVKAAGGCRAILCLAGSAPGRGGDLGDHLPLARATVRAGAEMKVPVLLASSAAVYGAPTNLQALSEDSPATPQADYGRIKLEMEQGAQELADQLGAQVTCLRIGNVAGSDAILGGWKTGFELDRFADGTTPSRSYIGPKSLAQTLFSLCDDQIHLPGILNIAAPGAVEMGALLDTAGLHWNARPAPDSAIKRVELDTSRLQSYVPLAPEAALAQRLVQEWRETEASGQ